MQMYNIHVKQKKKIRVPTVVCLVEHIVNVVCLTLIFYSSTVISPLNYRLIGGLILTACKPVKVYFMARG